MTRSLILVWADAETGEVMNADGTVLCKLGSVEPKAWIHTGNPLAWVITDRVKQIRINSGAGKVDGYKEPLYSAFRGYLSGAAVKLPEKKLSRGIYPPQEDTWNACLSYINSTIPKGN